MLPVALRSTEVAPPVREKGLEKGLSEKRATSLLQAPSDTAKAAANVTRPRAEEFKNATLERMFTHQGLRNATQR
jgi:hypothetical protein